MNSWFSRLINKIFVYCFLLLALSISTTGCWNRIELDKLAIVMGVGIDKAAEPGKIQVTAQISKPGGKNPSKNKNGGNTAFVNIKNTGHTLNSAIWGLTRESSRRLYFPHNQIIIFSREIAEDGLQRHLDFFLRNDEIRLTQKVVIAENLASDLLEVTSLFEKIPAIEIADMLEAQVLSSKSLAVNLQQLLARLLSKTTAPVAPIIKITGLGKEQTVLISGMAVFKDDKLAGQLNETETRGLLWVIGEVVSGIIDVDCPDGEGKASLHITRASSKISAEIRDGRIHIKIIIREEGDLAGAFCPENLALPWKLTELEQKKAAVIKSEVMAALTKARELNADIFGFGEAVHRQYRKEWQELKNNWDELFPYIEVELIVEAKLRRVGKFTAINPEQK
jgi:spore germination protein KC